MENDDHPESFAEDGPPTAGKVYIDMNMNRSLEETMSTETVRIKNTFIECEVPRSPTNASPPTNTAPGALQRLIKKRQQAPAPLGEENTPASEYASESPTRAPFFPSERIGADMADAPDMGNDRALSPPPPGLDLPATTARRDSSDQSDSQDELQETGQSSTIPACPPGTFSQGAPEANPLLQPSASLGSALHSSGGCNPCAWYWKPDSCSKGYNCSRCHMCTDGELKRRKKTKAKEVASNRKERKASVSSLGTNPYPERKRSQDGSFAAATQEPAYVVCGDTHRPVTFDTEFPDGIFHTKVTVGDVPVKNTFIDFRINRNEDDKKEEGPPTASAPGAMLSRLFKTRAKYAAAPPRLSVTSIPDNPFAEQLPETPQTGTSTPMRPPGVLLESAGNAEPVAGEGPVKQDEPELELQGEGHPMYQLHLTKECTPCNYFYYKADGCRQGVECQFCHLCPKGEIKKRKKERVKMLKAQSSEAGGGGGAPPLAAF